MNRRQRLMATLQGETVDRPPVSFYEINGLDESPNASDPFNIYSHPSWRPLVELAAERTDRIVMRSVAIKGAPASPFSDITDTQVYDQDGSHYTRQTIHIGSRTLTSLTRRDLDVNTTWTLEHLLKSPEDLRTWLQVPAQDFGGEPDTCAVLSAEKALGDSGIVMIDTGDPICSAASLFSMEDYTICAMTEPQLFTQLLERFARVMLPRTEAIAKALPGRLWRIYGPEYASPPYLPPRMFRDYVVTWDTPMVESIQKHGGFARLHSHGNLRAILDDIASTGCVGLDPIEPPPQGDVELTYVRERYGEQMVLFGNLEASDIENLPTDQFETKIARALDEGTRGHGRGLVLMPSACPYGRILPPLALANYTRMVEMVEGK